MALNTHLAVELMSLDCLDPENPNPVYESHAELLGFEKVCTPCSPLFCVELPPNWRAFFCFL